MTPPIGSRGRSEKGAAGRRSRQQEQEEPDSGGGGGSGNINVGSPGSLIYENPMRTADDVDGSGEYEALSHSGNISIRPDPTGEYGDVAAIFASQGSTRGASILWKHPDESRDGSRTGVDDPDSAYAQTHILFPSDAQIYNPNESTHGTKLPGISGYYTEAGNGGDPGDGHSWSARTQNEEITSSTSNDGWRQNVFPYHMDQPGTYGDKEPWNGEYPFGEWVKQTMYVEMNTPGEYDGIIRGWMDDTLVYERTDYRFRSTDHPDAGITRAYGGYIYWGGSWGSPKDQYVYFRDFTLTHGHTE